MAVRKKKKEMCDFVAASKKTGKQKLKICACNLAFLSAIYRKILNAWKILLTASLYHQ